MRCGVYAIIHVPSGSAYVGGSSHIVNRFTWHRHSLRNGRHSSPEFQKLWNLTRPSDWVFVVVEFCRAQRSIMVREQYWLQNWPGTLLNEKKTADGVGYRVTSEAKRNMSVSAKRAANTPEQKRLRSLRAKQQHLVGKLGAATRKNILRGMVNCGYCGVEFYQKSGHRQRFCSYTCSNRSRRKVSGADGNFRVLHGEGRPRALYSPETAY